MSPAGLKSLDSELREKSFIIYLNPSEDIRLERLESRNDSDNAKRRFINDKSDFFNFLDYDIVITNEDF